MSRTVCFDRADQSRYQDRIDAADSAAALLKATEASIAEDLRKWMCEGMADPSKARAMPHVRFINGRDTEAFQPFAVALADMLDYDDVFAEMLGVLKHSTCPLVAALRTAIADKYAAMYAYDLALVECGE